ncbi:hypothetical protein [uncultured Bacteroides sp.]|uniref:hypothetical protein n=1 Tax=uncultured Bacteroides sp. TaxID=162156 RepID=UPI00266FF92D|nr:hypothetical protein [uncultured Bacteroides sp.]
MDEAVAKLEAADKDALKQLQDKVKELNDALKGKADAAKVEQLTKEIGDLTAQVNGMAGDLDAFKEELNQKIAGLQQDLDAKKKQLEDLKKDVDANAGEIASVKEDIEKLTKDLADTKTELAELSNTVKSQGAQIAELMKQIAKLTDIEKDITDLQEADEQFAIKQAAIEADLANINKDLADYNKQLTDHIAAWDNYVKTTDVKFQDIYDKLTTLNSFKDAIKLALEDGRFDDFAALVTEVNDLRDKCTELASNISDLNDAWQAGVQEVEDQLTALAGKVTELEKELGAMKNMIQSVSYVPTYADGVVDFTILKAKKNQTDDFTGLLQGGLQEIKFRISPATAAADFATNYDVEFSADQKLQTRAGESLFEVVGAPKVEGGIITYTVKANTPDSYAVCMHVTTKADKVATLGKTDITSDYFATSSGEEYLMDVQYVFNDGKVALDETLSINEEDESVDFNLGRVALFIADSKTGTPVQKELSAYPGISEELFETTIAVDEANKTYFKVEEGVVSLSKYNDATYIGKVGTVSANVALTGFYTPSASTNLGTVTIKTAIVEIDYGTIEVEWSNSVQTVDATKFDVKKIYDDPRVKITLAEYQALVATVEDTEKADFVTGTDNELTATVEAQTKAGEYPIELKLASADETREIKVKATIKVVYPKGIELATNDLFWFGEIADGKVGFSPTLLDNSTQPKEIQLSYDLSKLFSNYGDVKAAIDAIPGATLEITVPNVDNIAGLSFDDATTTLTFDKDTYTGETLPTVKAVVKLGDNVYQEANATVAIVNISGTWVAGTTAYRIENKAATYELAKGFAWNDLRGVAMWNDGAAVTGDTQNFAAGVEPLAMYGFTAPTFELTGDNVAEAKGYVNLNPATGALTLTETGKSFVFVKDYEIKVKVVAKSQWGAINNYAEGNIITVTIPRTEL